jgi:retinol dehydrogenase 12
MGHFLLQKLLIPLLRKSAKQSGEARIIWTASDATNTSPSTDGINWADINGQSKDPGSWALYSQSKAGNVIIASETARRYGSNGIISVSLNPGHLRTELQRNMGSYVTSVLNATLLYDARYGALTELFAGFSSDVNQTTNGAYLIPWGRIGKVSSHIAAGLDNGSGDRLWKLLEQDTEQYV